MNLVTIPGVELMRTGTWNISTGTWTVTPETIQAAITSHESGVLRKPVIRLGHNDSRFSGDPAVGYVDNIRASLDGETLLGDLVGVPQWLGDIMASAYPDRSVEGLSDYTAPDGSNHGFVLTGLALLGVTRPGVESLRSLQDVARLYDIAAAGQVGGTAIELPILASDGAQTPQPAEAEVAKGKEGFMPTLKEGLVQKLGIPADADDETTLKALEEALAERAEPVIEPVEPTLEQATQVAAAAGLATITTEALDALKVEAAAGAQAREQQIRESCERTVDSAITEGKIAPARRDHHLAALKADREGHTTVLASLQPGLVPIVEAGHGVTKEINNEDDATYASLFGKDA